MILIHYDKSKSSRVYQLEIDHLNVKLNNIGAPKLQNNFLYTIKLLILLTMHSIQLPQKQIVAINDLDLFCISFFIWLRILFFIAPHLVIAQSHF